MISHQIQQDFRIYQHLLGSIFLVDFTAPNKHSTSVNLLFKSLGHVSNT